jgi:hypothetical protein
MKKKPVPGPPIKKRDRLSKIAKAPVLHDKMTLAVRGMTAAEWYAAEMSLARDLFQTRRIDPRELKHRAEHELSAGALTARTEHEVALFRSLEKRLYRFTWTAARQWKPEMLEKLARAMRKIQKHRIPNSSDGLSRTGDSRCNSSAILLASVNAATRVTALSRPIPRTLLKSSTDARAIAPREPNLQTNCLPISTAFTPRKPVLTRMATSSAGLNACAPHSMSRSRGRSPAGWSLSLPPVPAVCSY